MMSILRRTEFYLDNSMAKERILTSGSYMPRNKYIHVMSALLARDDDITCLTETEEEGPHFSESPLAISENLQLISDNYLTSFLSLSIQKRLILALQIHK